MGAAVARVALEGAARSRGQEAGGVTRDSNAHLTASLSLSTDGRARRVDRGPACIKSPMFTTFGSDISGRDVRDSRSPSVSMETPAPRDPDRRSLSGAFRQGIS